MTYFTDVRTAHGVQFQRIKNMKMVVQMEARCLLLSSLVFLSAMSFLFPRSLIPNSRIINSGIYGGRTSTVCNGQRKKKIHICEWAENFDGALVQKDNVMYLEQPVKKRVTAAEEMLRKPSTRICMLVKGGTKGNNIGNCHLVHFIRMVLDYKSINCTILPYPIYDRPGFLIPTCPNEEPCMMYDGYAYYDPYIITRHLSFFHPTPEIDADDHMINECCNQLYSSFHDYMVATEVENENESKELMLKTLSDLSNLIKSNNPKKDGETCYVRGGTCIGLSDCALAPILYQMKIAGKHFKAFEIPPALTSLLDYQTSIFSKKAFQNTIVSEKEVIWGWQKSINATKIKKKRKEIALLKKEEELAKEALAKEEEEEEDNEEEEDDDGDGDDDVDI